MGWIEFVFNDAANPGKRRRGVSTWVACHERRRACTPRAGQGKGRLPVGDTERVWARIPSPGGTRCPFDEHLTEPADPAGVEELLKRRPASESGGG